MEHSVLANIVDWTRSGPPTKLEGGLICIPSGVIALYETGDEAVNWLDLGRNGICNIIIPTVLPFELILDRIKINQHVEGHLLHKLL